VEPQERQLVLDQLASSEARLLELVDGLTPEQWGFRETPERWSIAENIEHVIMFEKFLLRTIRELLRTPAEPEKRASVVEKEAVVLQIATTRGTKFNAREIVLPTGRWPDTAGMIAELRKTRERTIAFVAGTQDDLRNHFFPHVALGDLDCYQWLVIMAQHGARHALQIEEIKSDPGYPAS
jgi:DinB superfamily